MEDYSYEDFWDLEDSAGSRRTMRQDIIHALSGRIVKTIQEKSEKPIQDIKDGLPSTSEEVRNLPFYNSTLGAIKNQRDIYLVGQIYARRKQRARAQGLISPTQARIPYDPTALGSIQIANIGASFIPSATVHNALLPLVVSLPSGVLKTPITNAVANAIPLAQPQLDSAVKNSVMAFMDNPHWRQVIKNRAGGYMSTRDSPPPKNEDRGP